MHIPDFERVKLGTFFAKKMTRHYCSLVSDPGKSLNCARLGLLRIRASPDIKYCGRRLSSIK